jgi:hypothetical protein
VVPVDRWEARWRPKAELILRDRTQVTILIGQKVFAKDRNGLLLFVRIFIYI